MPIPTLAIVAISVLLSLAPAFIWGGIFLYRHGEKRSELVRIFMLGGLMVIPLFIYRLSWKFFPEVNIIEQLRPLENKKIIIDMLGRGEALIVPISIIVLFLSIGIIEEYLKGRVARSANRKEICTIDDAIEFSIIAALGFSFAENTFYFIQVAQVIGFDALVRVFLFRSLFSTFAHVLFSAIYGYHLGLALFAKPVYREMSKQSLHRRFIHWIHKSTKIKGADLFEDQQMFTGLFYAAALHAVFNIMLELGQTQFLIPFLIIGFIHVMIIIWDRKNHVEYK